MPCSSVLLLLYSASFRVVWANESPEAYQTEGVVGRYIWDCCGSQLDKTNLQAAMLRCLADQTPQTVDIRDCDGVWWRARFWPLPFPEVKLASLSCRFPENFWRLTDREREVCTLIAEGLRTKEIAAALDVARSTVDNHRANISQKLKIDSASLDAWCGQHRNWLPLKTPEAVLDA